MLHSTNFIPINEMESYVTTHLPNLSKNDLFYIVDKYKPMYSISMLCNSFHVSRSGYYKWSIRKNRPNSELYIAECILDVQETADYTIGYRRMVRYLNIYFNLDVGGKKLYRIMKQYNLLSRAITSKENKVLSKAYQTYPNLIKDNFKATEVNQKWAMDITVINTLAQGKLYLNAIQDLYDHSIIAYKVHSTCHMSLVTETIKDAVKSNGISPDNPVILHTDQGSQFSGKTYNNLSRTLHFIPSFSRKGTPTDNAMIENFFSCLKRECINRYTFKTKKEAIDKVNAYIFFYNTFRIQENLGCTPNTLRSVSF